MFNVYTLFLAIARNYTNVAMVLLHAGADFDLANGQGYTSIHLAAREGLLGLAQSLCAFGCVVDVTASDGVYPIHLAAKNGHTEVVRCLCLAGCRIDVKNKEGVTPELAALSQGHGEISDLLKRLKRVCCYLFIVFSLVEREFLVTFCEGMELRKYRFFCSSALSCLARIAPL